MKDFIEIVESLEGNDLFNSQKELVKKFKMKLSNKKKDFLVCY